MPDNSKGPTSQRQAAVLLCSCEGTMPLDPERAKAGCKDASLTLASHLCTRELGVFRRHAKEGRLTVACTHQAALFEEVAEDDGLQAELTFVNVRETAGWSKQAAAAGPKMAALIAAAAETEPPPAGVTLESEGITLVYGNSQTALDVANRLKDRLDITVLLREAADVLPAVGASYPVRKGKIRSLTGSLGTFDITVDAYAEPAASSRGHYSFGPQRNGAASRADIVIDVTGDASLVSAPDLRDGYLRADPNDAIAIERLIAKAADLVGTFDKPRYIAFDPALCAHSRSRITGCSRCLSLCPTGAITPNGNTVVVDPAICGGCGQCAAVCPTGAAAYDLPKADLMLRKIRALLTTYRTAGGADPVLLVHDREHGTALLEASAHVGDGLPARVLPLAVNEVTQVGLEAVVAAFAHGASAVRFLTRARPRHDLSGLAQTVETATALLCGLGWAKECVATIAADDPDAMSAALFGIPVLGSTSKPSQFMAFGSKREVLKLAVRELHRAAPAPVDEVALPAGAAFGAVRVNEAGCTLCLACVGTCPTGALGDAQDRPLLKFDESLCVQCGLCRATCPEKVITLEPRLNFAGFDAGFRTLKEEEPFCCIRCAKPFGTRSTIEKVIAKLESTHWMFEGKGQSRLDLLRMCEDCRVIAATDESLDPYAAPIRSGPKTTEDYLKERAEREKAMLDKIKRGDA